MKKTMACILAVLMALMAFAPAASAAEGKGEGGVMGFVVGCCFGARSAAAYNDGKNLHWKEWGQLIPIFSIVVCVVNGVDGWNGLTTADMAAKYGAQYY